MNRSRKKKTWPQFIVIEILLMIVVPGALYAIASHFGRSQQAAMFLGGFGAGAGTVIIFRRVLPFIPRITVHMPKTTTRRRPANGKGKSTP